MLGYSIKAMVTYHVMHGNLSSGIARGGGFRMLKHSSN